MHVQTQGSKRHSNTLLLWPLISDKWVDYFLYTREHVNTVEPVAAKEPDSACRSWWRAKTDQKESEYWTYIDQLTTCSHSQLIEYGSLVSHAPQTMSQ